MSNSELSPEQLEQLWRVREQLVQLGITDDTIEMFDPWALAFEAFAAGRASIEPEREQLRGALRVCVDALELEGPAVNCFCPDDDPDDPFVCDICQALAVARPIVSSD